MRSPLPCAPDRPSEILLVQVGHCLLPSSFCLKENRPPRGGIGGRHVIVPPSPIHRLGSRGFLYLSFSDFTWRSRPAQEKKIPSGVTASQAPGQRPREGPCRPYFSLRRCRRARRRSTDRHPSPRSLSPRPSTARPATARAELASWPRSPPPPSCVWRSLPYLTLPTVFFLLVVCSLVLAPMVHHLHFDDSQK